ncbi:hypothetical protein [Bremerella sp. TYQ1]|uniref:hypothetical protein n=1 Tax=Bremerella sp. TYQ1 TaxID=3119568 RepID=UPI001CCE8827|nr:hypothetical protein [Bremerella volcania]UBM38364.1 hypothetical protein LA756_10790 [Bremerella volcania]
MSQISDEEHQERVAKALQGLWSQVRELEESRRREFETEFPGVRYPQTEDEWVELAYMLDIPGEESEWRELAQKGQLRIRVRGRLRRLKLLETSKTSQTITSSTALATQRLQERYDSAQDRFAEYSEDEFEKERKELGLDPITSEYKRFIRSRKSDVRKRFRTKSPKGTRPNTSGAPKKLK